MIKISLTSFIDVVTSSGSPKLTKILELKNRGDYHPVMDYWGPLREHIVKYHKVGEGDKRYLDGLIPTLDKPSKQANCRNLITNYKRFLGRKAIETLVPPTATWRYESLAVRINPEVYLSMDGVRHIIKLYFKARPLSVSQVGLIHLLMTMTLSQKLEAPVTYTVYDAHHNRPYSTTNSSNRLLPLLYGEADGLISTWNRLPEPPE